MKSEWRVLESRFEWIFPATRSETSTGLFSRSRSSYFRIVKACRGCDFYWILVGRVLNFEDWNTVTGRGKKLFNTFTRFFTFLWVKVGKTFLWKTASFIELSKSFSLEERQLYLKICFALGSIIFFFSFILHPAHKLELLKAVNVKSKPSMKKGPCLVKERTLETLFPPKNWQIWVETAIENYQHNDAIKTHLVMLVSLPYVLSLSECFFVGLKIMIQLLPEILSRFCLKALSIKRTRCSC